MKKFEVVLVTISLFFTVFLLSGCGKASGVVDDSDQSVKGKSVAEVLTEQFQDEIKSEKDIGKVASKISKNEILDIQVEVSAIEKGDYISGFQTEIQGFDRAVAIRPMIGSIPFVAYIFEVENAEQFAENLKSSADLRWNICTEADDLEVATVDDYVFFIMSPENFDQE